MDLVIVESPAKAKTINKYLGRGFEVMASFGHIRDLPAKNGSVDPEADFAMLWEVDAKASKRVSDIVSAARTADKIILATDPDREGEAISWHVLEMLRQKKVLKDKPVERVVFNAITRDSVTEAMRHPRAIDQPLVDAYLARRALDYLVGFNLSPVLWRKLPGARSAGRVQSVALRLICEREREIEIFIKREYWSILAHLKTAKGESFTARLVGADGKKINRLDVGTAAEAQTFESALLAARFSVTSVEAKPVKRHPSPPFTTSTLQQEAARKLGFAPARTMQLAQKLYEGIDLGGETVGLITYMRTDGVDIVPEAITALRKVIGRDFAPRFLPGAPRKYLVKAKNAQEAHEAIRPTDPTRHPREMARHLDADQARLYELIWNRTIACQMESAELERTTVELLAEAGTRKLDLRATGQVVRFEGFLALYQEGRDDESEDEAARLPAMAPGDMPTRERIAIDQHFTEPPPRFSEASLVKRMEELGIGRPSTYASTLAVLRDREYVKLEKKRLVPEDKGRIVTSFLESFFSRYVSFDFTAGLEEQLDRVSNNEINWKVVLHDFWKDFSAAIGETKDLRTTQVLDHLNESLAAHIFPQRAEGGDPRLCPSCNKGQLSLKLSKFGAFVGCANYPECKYTRQLSVKDGEGVSSDPANRPGVTMLGPDPATGDAISLRDGRFGVYVQQGEGEKPKRSSLPKGMVASEVTLSIAIRLLLLPREVALHPVSKAPIVAGIGKYGAYVQHAKTYANLGPDDNVLEIGANRAIDLIVAKESGVSTRFGGGTSAGRVIGPHPDGGDITLKSGRFGPYVNFGKINATLPKGTDPETLDLASALAMLTAKAEGGGGAEGGRVLGNHPSGGAITLRDGRYGAYVSHGKTNATLPKGSKLEDLSLSEAIELIDNKFGSAPPARAKPAARTKLAAKPKATASKAKRPAAAKPASKKAAKKG